MVGTLTIQPMTAGGAQTGDVIGHAIAEFDKRSFIKARNKFGKAIIDAVIAARLEDPTADLFDLTLQLTLSEEEFGKRQFLVEESATYRVMATSAAEAERLYLDKGDEIAERMDSSIDAVYEGDA